MLPNLWGEDLPSAIKWIKEFLAQKRQEEQLTLTEGAPVSSESSGMSRVYFGDTPAGWLPLNGSLVFISEAPTLYALIGLAYDANPPANMFRLPPAPSVLASGQWIIKR